MRMRKPSASWGFATALACQAFLTLRTSVVNPNLHLNKTTRAFQADADEWLILLGQPETNDWRC
jgi:hypothetical protein